MHAACCCHRSKPKETMRQTHQRRDKTGWVMMMSMSFCVEGSTVVFSKADAALTWKLLHSGKLT